MSGLLRARSEPSVLLVCAPSIWRESLPSLCPDDRPLAHPAFFFGDPRAAGDVFCGLASGLQGTVVMRIAIPVWNGRVSPVFDVSRSARILDILEGTATDVADCRLENHGRAEALVRRGVDLLICAAISTPLESALWLSGIEVLPDTCGTVEEIIDALVAGETDLARFRSPGNVRELCSSHTTLSHQRTNTEASR